MVLLVRALVVSGVNAALGLAASRIALVARGDSTPLGSVGAVTFGWLIPMTAVCALALAVATVARSAVVGAAAV